MADSNSAYIENEFDVGAKAILDEERLCDAINSRYYELRYQRVPWDEIWRELFSYVLPEREFLLHWYENSLDAGGQESARNYVKRIGQHIYDSTAPNSLQLLAAGIQGYVVSEQDRWFRFTFPHPDMIEMLSLIHI